MMTKAQELLYNRVCAMQQCNMFVTGERLKEQEAVLEDLQSDTVKSMFARDEQLDPVRYKYLSLLQRMAQNDASYELYMELYG